MIVIIAIDDEKVVYTIDDANYYLYPSQFSETNFIGMPTQYKHIKIDDEIFRKYKQDYGPTFYNELYIYVFNIYENTLTVT
jgi:hypothetical protein